MYVLNIIVVIAYYSLCLYYVTYVALDKNIH